MQLPKGYDPALSDILDAHASCGVPPGWFALNALHIRDAFKTFLADKKLSSKHVLDLGGRSAPFLIDSPLQLAACYEPRGDYRAVRDKLFGRTPNVAPKALQDFSKYDLILINMELGGLEENELSPHINLKFDRSLNVYGYWLLDPELERPGRRPLEGGEIFDRERAIAWGRTLTGHMHLGAQRTRIGVVDFVDLRMMYDRITDS